MADIHSRYIEKIYMKFFSIIPLYNTSGEQIVRYFNAEKRTNTMKA